MVKSLWEKFWQFIIKLNIYVLYDTEILLLTIYPSKMKKDLYSIVLSSFIIIAKKLETGQVLTNTFIEWNILRNTKELIIDACNNMDKSQKHYSE